MSDALTSIKHYLATLSVKSVGITKHLSGQQAEHSTQYCAPEDSRRAQPTHIFHLCQAVYFKSSVPELQTAGHAVLLPHCISTHGTCLPMPKLRLRHTLSMAAVYCLMVQKRSLAGPFVSAVARLSFCDMHCLQERGIRCVLWYPLIMVTWWRCMTSLSHER